MVRADKTRNQRRQKISKVLSSYLRFEIEWWYKFSAKAGEKIYLIYKSDYDKLTSDYKSMDFWLFDEKDAVYLIYDKEGRLLDIKPVIDRKEIKKLIELKRILLNNTIPLNNFLISYKNLF